MELRCFDDDRTVDALFLEAQSPPMKVLTKVTDLRIIPWGEQFYFPKSPLATLQRRPKIDSLTLDFWHYDRLMRRMFRDPSIIGRPRLPPISNRIVPLNHLSLKKLNLSHVNLRGCGQFLMPAIGWLRLQELSVLQCICAQDLFLALNALPDNSKPRLHCLTVIYTSWQDQKSILQALSDFLIGIEEVLYSLELAFSKVSDVIHTDGFRKHSKTLQELVIGLPPYCWSLGSEETLTGVQVGSGIFGDIFAGFKKLK